MSGSSGLSRWTRRRRPGGAPSPAECGFTLVELLVALAIVGALVTVALGGLRVALGAWQQGEDRTEAHQNTRGVAVLLARAVGAIYPYRASLADAPDPKLVFYGEPSRIGFVTQAPPFPLAAPVAFTAVVLELDAEQGLVIRERALPNRNPLADAAVVLSEPSVTTLEFRYLGEDGTWQDTWEDDDAALPHAIEITIATTVRGRVEKLPPLTVSIRYRASQ